MAYALANLWRNLRAGFRLACFRPVARLDFRVDLTQLVLLFALSAAIDGIGDFLRTSPPREFSLLGAGSELYSAALLLLGSALIALVNRQRHTALAVPVLVLASLPVVQLLHYVPSWLPLAGRAAEAAIVFDYVVVSWIVLILVRCVALGFDPPPSFLWLRAIVWGLVLATPIWLGDLLIDNSPWWRDVTDEPVMSGEFHAGSEAVLAAQAKLLDNALDDLSDERGGETDLYFVGFAPWGRSDDYRTDVEAARKVMDERWGTADRSILLVNNPRSLITFPFATVTNLRATLDEIGGIIDPEDDVVMLYLASPSVRNNRLAAEQPPLTLVELGPQGLKRLLDDAGIKWRIVVVSACYSGGFVDALADDYTLVITDASASGPGMGCDDRSPATLFGDAFFQQGLGKRNSFEAAFEIAKARIAERERAAGYAPVSQPQWSMGAQMAAKIKTLRKRGASGSTARALQARPLRGQAASLRRDKRPPGQVTRPGSGLTPT